MSFRNRKLSARGFEHRDEAVRFLPHTARIGASLGWRIREAHGGSSVRRHRSGTGRNRAPANVSERGRVLLEFLNDGLEVGQ